ncbi:MAG TPA: XRE family transcriptional regulator [Gammaproteobacteria bacterium]|jgi:transcriptional regulator with XRE-family HTH domain|nr:XRE family transcriptional regulator [Gammaproteobacteria bacterium]
MSKQTIASNLQKLLKTHGDLSLSDLARETRIPQPTLHHIVEGKTKKPRRQALQSLADFFSISVSQLTGSIPFSPILSESIKTSLKISTVPLIKWEDAKDWQRSKNDLSRFDEIILKNQIDKNAFALRLLNSSLEPLFQEQSILIFDPSKNAKDRDFVLVFLANSESLIFNRLFIDNNKYYIKEDKHDGNVMLTKLNFSQDKIIATLIEARLQF